MSVGCNGLSIRILHQGWRKFHTRITTEKQTEVADELEKYELPERYSITKWKRKKDLILWFLLVPILLSLAVMHPLPLIGLTFVLLCRKSFNTTKKYQKDVFRALDRIDEDCAVLIDKLRDLPGDAILRFNARKRDNEFMPRIRLQQLYDDEVEKIWKRGGL